MNKKFLISSVVVFVAWMAGSMLVHGVMLGEAYEGMGSMVRTVEDQAAYFPYMILAHVFMSVAFVWIYQRGAEDKPWPMDIVVRQIVGDTALVIVLGVIVAALNKPASST